MREIDDNFCDTCGVHLIEANYSHMDEDGREYCTGDHVAMKAKVEEMLTGLMGSIPKALPAPQKWIRIPGPGEMRGEGPWWKIEEVNCSEDDWEFNRRSGYLPTHQGQTPPAPAPAPAPEKSL